MKKKIRRAFIITIIVEVLISAFFFSLAYALASAFPDKGFLTVPFFVLGIVFILMPYFTKMVWGYTSLLVEEEEKEKK